MAEHQCGTVSVQVKLPYAAIRAHLLLLLLTFAVLIPAGLLSSRHSWLFVDDKKVSRCAHAGRGTAAYSNCHCKM